MRKFILSLGAFLAVLMIVPSVLMAQQPPPCCPRSPSVPGESQMSPLNVHGLFTVSTEILQSQGITRRQFVERLSASIFPDRTVDLILSSKVVVSQPVFSSSRAGSGIQNPDAGTGGLIAIQETRYFRVSPYSLTAEEMEGLEQFGLTDGNIQINVKFTKSSPLGSDTQ